MSQFKYIANMWFNGKDWIYGDESIRGRDKALEDLLKNEVRECFQCKGVGEDYPFFAPVSTPEDHMEACQFCQGGGFVCAWCHQSEHGCECGEQHDPK